MITGYCIDKIKSSLKIIYDNLNLNKKFNTYDLFKILDAELIAINWNIICCEKDLTSHDSKVSELKKQLKYPNCEKCIMEQLFDLGGKVRILKEDLRKFKNKVILLKELLCKINTRELDQFSNEFYVKVLLIQEESNELYGRKVDIAEKLFYISKWLKNEKINYVRKLNNNWRLKNDKSTN